MFRKSYRLLIFCFCLLMLNSAYSQGIRIKYRNGAVVNGDTIILEPQLTQKPPYTEIDIYLHVQNNNSHAIVLKAKKTEFLLNSTARHCICFAKACHDSTTYVAPGIANLAGGQTDSTFSGHYYYLADVHTPVKDLVAYTFYDQNNPADSALVYVVYNSIKPTSVATQTMASVRIYPNPTSNKLSITGINGSALVTVYDMTGKQVLAQTVSNTLNVEQLPHGNYLLHLTTDDERMTMKFVKE